MNNIDNMINALDNLKKAFNDVNKAWSECDKMNELKNPIYPFKDSFDELTLKVDDWIDSSISELKE